MPALEWHDAIAIVTGIVTLSGIVWALRSSVGKLEVKVELGQTELLRQLTALHKRLDDYGKRITRAERDQAVLEERVSNLRNTRFRGQPLVAEVPLRDEE